MGRRAPTVEAARNLNMVERGRRFLALSVKDVNRHLALCGSRDLNTTARRTKAIIGLCQIRPRCQTLPIALRNGGWRKTKAPSPNVPTNGWTSSRRSLLNGRCNSATGCYRPDLGPLRLVWRSQMVACRGTDEAL